MLISKCHFDKIKNKNKTNNRSESLTVIQLRILNDESM